MKKLEEINLLQAIMSVFLFLASSRCSSWNISRHSYDLLSKKSWKLAFLGLCHSVDSFWSTFLYNDVLYRRIDCSFQRSWGNRWWTVCNPDPPRRVPSEKSIIYLWLEENQLSNHWYVFCLPLLNIFIFCFPCSKVWWSKNEFEIK